MSTGRHAGPPHAVYPASHQYYTTEVVREVPYVGEHQYGGMEPHYGGMEPHYGGMAMPGHDGGGIPYDSMSYGSYHGHAITNGGPRAVSNYYSPSPAPSCGPKKEFERVLLNPQSTACTKPTSPSVPAAAPPPTCDNSCTSAQFVLQPASHAY